jgi:hypothetical protein
MLDPSLNFNGIDVFRVFLVLIMLAYSSYKDWKTREINDIVWIFFGSIGVILNIYALISGTMEFTLLLASVGFSIVFAAVIGYLGLFGEADLLALVAITVISPLPPRIGFNTLGITPLLMPLSVLSNSVFIGACFSLIVLLLNLLNWGEVLFTGYMPITFWKKVLLMFTGRNVDLTKIRGPPFQYPLEKINDEGKVSIILRPDFMADKEAVSTLKKLVSAGRQKGWVTYTLPFLLFFLVGYLASIIIGDIILSAIIFTF